MGSISIFRKKWQREIMKSPEIERLPLHTVRLQFGDRFLGTGFVVTSELILTCFHVVREARENNSPIDVWWQNKELIAVAIKIRT